MTQLWTIYALADDAVLYAGFGTPSAADHPKDFGWAWDGDTQGAVAIPAAPGPAQRWNGSAWVDDLDALRAARWERVKARRDQAEWAGCDTALGRVDTDPDSQRKTGGAVQMAMIAQAAGAPFSIDWTMQDNSTVSHDAPAMIAMGIAVGQHVAACHEAALGKRAAIDAASTAEDIAAVDIESGWPS